MSSPRPLLVLGVGNVYYGDEGAGVHALHYLRTRYRFPEHVALVDGGTLGWQLLGLIAEYRHVVLIDAVAAPVGRVYRFTRDEVPAEVGFGKLSSHEWEVPDLLTAMALHGDLPDVTIVAIGVAPAQLEGSELAVGLSDAVRGRVGALTTVVLRELERLGAAPPEVAREVAPDTRFTLEELTLHA